MRSSVHGHTLKRPERAQESSSDASLSSCSSIAPAAAFTCIRTRFRLHGGQSEYAHVYALASLESEPLNRHHL